MSQVMVLEGWDGALGQDEPVQTQPDPTIRVATSSRADKIVGWFLAGYIGWFVWKQFQPTSGRPGMTIAWIPVGRVRVEKMKGQPGWWVVDSTGKKVGYAANRRAAKRVAARMTGGKPKGLGDPPATHRLRVRADVRRAGDSVYSAGLALEKDRCVSAFHHTEDALVSAGAAMAESRGVGDVAASGEAGEAVRLAINAHRAAIKACARMPR